MRLPLILALLLAAGGPALRAEDGGSSGRIILMKSDDYSDPFDKVEKVVKEHLGSSSDAYQIRVQVRHNSSRKPDYMVAYVLSSKDYSIKTSRIDVDEDWGFKSTRQGYSLAASDYAGQDGDGAECPDPSVTFVAATSEEGIPSAKSAVQEIESTAKAAGAKTAALSGADATAQKYLGYLKCPKLKGFFSVGHGSPQGLMLSDGMLSSDKIKAAKLGSQTVVLFNSCEVFNDPFKGAVLGASPKKYAGGVSELSIGPSEEASKCFWKDAFANKPLTDALHECAQKKDSGDTWGIEGSGSDTMGGKNGSSHSMQLKPLADMGSAASSF